ncbi:MAG: hypothetical protein JST54_02185 [Deltaproteobacteria bacterium]|nr:hypothetical protein [Deltaproteobacteria bacterium]
MSPRDCAAAAETISLLVAAWQRTLPTSTSADPLDQAAHITVTPTKDQEPGTRNQELTSPQPPAPSHPPEPKVEPTSITPAIPDPADAGSGSGSVALTLDAGAPPAPIVVATAPPEPDAGVLIALADPPKEVPVIKIEPPPAEQEVQQPSPWHLAAGVEVGGALGLDQSEQQGALAAVVEVDRGERWGGQLTLAFDSRQQASQKVANVNGFVSATRQTLALQAVARFHPLSSHPSGALRVELGPLLERLGAQAFRYSAQAAKTEYTPGLAVGVAYEEAFGPATFTIGPKFEILAQQTTFGIQDLTQAKGPEVPILPLPVAWAGLDAGLRANFF